MSCCELSYVPFFRRYEYCAGCGIDVGHDHHPGTEPSQPNVTVNPNRATIKWAGLILPTTPVPTTTNADCSLCDPQPSPVPAGTVGAFEGADYYHCGSYRAEFNCRMQGVRFRYCYGARRAFASGGPDRVRNRSFNGIPAQQDVDQRTFILEKKQVPGTVRPRGKGTRNGESWGENNHDAVPDMLAHERMKPRPSITDGHQLAIERAAGGKVWQRFQLRIPAASNVRWWASFRRLCAALLLRMQLS